MCLSQFQNPLLYFLFTFAAARPAAFSTSSVCYPGSLAAYTTFVNCVARGCGTAATSPLWSVQVNTQTHRAAPMEAPPSPSPPRPPHRPHPHPHLTPPLHLHRRAREAPKHGTFSPSGNSPEVEVMGCFCSYRSMLAQQMFGSIWTACCPPTSPYVLSMLLISPSNVYFWHLTLPCGAMWNTALPDYCFQRSVSHESAMRMVCCWTDLKSRSCFPLKAERTITSHYVGLELLQVLVCFFHRVSGQGVVSESEATGLHSCRLWPWVKRNCGFIHRTWTWTFVLVFSQRNICVNIQ